MASVTPALPRPLIAIVGRPNVGKSTLFNRLVGRRQAVVSPSRGTTRDRLYGAVEWRGRRFTLIDTGGFELEAGPGLPEAVQRHRARAVDEADLILFVCDGQEGVVPADELILQRLRTSGKPVVVVANKLDHELSVPAEFFALGGVERFPLSATHGRGTNDLLDRLVAGVPGAGAAGLTGPAIAIIGRQNVGKSSLFNTLLREERTIVSELPGTTRDAVDTVLEIQGAPVTLVDTAGLRHRRKIRTPVDLFSMARTVEAIKRCQVALLVLDGTMGVTRDDQRILERVLMEGCGLVFVVNKWDLVKNGQEDRLTEGVHRAAPTTRFAPVVATSAKTGYQVMRALRTALEVSRALHRGLPDAELTALLQRAWASRTPPRFRGRSVMLTKARWVPGRPARVELMMRPLNRLPGPYQQYLLKRLYAYPAIAGIPVRLSLRERNA